MCRLCQRSSLGNKVRKLVNMKAHCDFINNHYLQVNFNTEDRARYPQNICNSCFQALYYSMNKEKLFVSKQKKLPKARRTEFVIDKKITIVDDGDWDHNENCKVCYNDIIQQQQHEVEEPKSPEPPSPGTVKRKEIDSFLTPQAKKAQRNKSGSGQPRQLFLKSQNLDNEMEVDGEEHAIHIASDNDIIKKENVKDKNVFEAVKCVICQRIPRDPLILDRCGHYCCRVCLDNFKKISKKCPKCGKTFAVDTIVRLPKEVEHIYNCITVNCHKCKNEMIIEELNEHEENCHGRRSGRIKSNLKDMSVKYKQRVIERVKPLVDALQNLKEEHMEDPSDALFYVLGETLKSEDVKLYKNIENLHECYVTNNYDDLERKKMSVEMSAALKANANLTYRDVVKINRFQNKNTPEQGIASADEVCHFEDKLDVGNVTYNLIRKETKEVMKEHIATTEDATIDMDEDIGCISADMLNVPAEGIRINIQDGVAKNLEEIYPNVIEEI